MSLEKIIKNRPFQLIWAALFVVGSILLFIGITTNTLWYDESFTGALVRHSFVDAVKIAAGDNHAPFYFILTKLLTVLMGNSEFSLRSASLLGVVALAALGFGPVKRIWGEKAALLYTLFVFVTPAFVSQALNARMYTWGAFFCTASALYAYLAVLENKLRDWIIFSAAVIAGMYTHVYLVLECFSIYALVFAWLVLKDRKKIIRLFISGAVVSLLYLPWAFIVMKQAAKVAKDFWIPLPTSPWILSGTVFIPFQHEFGSSLPPALLYIACILGILLLILGTCNALKNKSDSGLFFFMCLAVCVMTIAGAFVLSYIVKPILMPRYLTSIIGLYVLIWVYGIMLLKNKILRIAGVCLLLAVFIPQLVDSKMVKRNGPTPELINYIDNKAGTDDVFVHSDEHTFGIFCYYYPQYRHYLLLKQGFSGFGNYDAFAPAGQAGHYYGDFVKGHGRVWLVNRIVNNFSQFPPINHQEFERYGKLYKVGLDKRFSQDNSFLNVSITEFSPDAADKLNEAELFSGDMREFRIAVEGFRNDQGQAVINILNREMNELCVNYLWKNKAIDQVEKRVYDKLVTNNNFLSNEEKAFLADFYTLDENSAMYKLTKKASEKDTEMMNSILRKLVYANRADITGQKAQFVVKGLPKGMYYVFLFHDENSDYQLEMRENAPPAEGIAVSGAENGLQGEPTFDSNYIVLDQDDMDTLLRVYYY